MGRTKQCSRAVNLQRQDCTPTSLDPGSCQGQSGLKVADAYCLSVYVLV